jgi:hypothetical protein
VCARQAQAGEGRAGARAVTRTAAGGRVASEPAREAAAAGLPFTAANVPQDLRLRVVELSMVFEVPSNVLLTRMWVVSRESEPVGLPAHTLVTSPDGRLSARFDASALAKLPLVPLDVVVKSGRQTRHCTIPAAAVRNVIGR